MSQSENSLVYALLLIHAFTLLVNATKSCDDVKKEIHDDYKKFLNCDTAGTYWKSIQVQSITSYLNSSMTVTKYQYLVN